MGLGFPKPRPVILDRISYKRERDARDRAFRAAVWLRDGGRCRSCNRKVIHTLDVVPNRGEVHHRRGRRVAPEDRVNVDAAVLLCLICHTDPDVIALFRRTP